MKINLLNHLTFNLGLLVIVIAIVVRSGFESVFKFWVNNLDPFFCIDSMITDLAMFLLEELLYCEKFIYDWDILSYSGIPNPRFSKKSETDFVLLIR